MEKIRIKPDECWISYWYWWWKILTIAIRGAFDWIPKLKYWISENCVKNLSKKSPRTALLISNITKSYISLGLGENFSLIEIPWTVSMLRHDAAACWFCNIKLQSCRSLMPRPCPWFLCCGIMPQPSASALQGK